jgi:hypothetical protein
VVPIEDYVASEGEQDTPKKEVQALHNDDKAAE